MVERWQCSIASGGGCFFEFLFHDEFCEPPSRTFIHVRGDYFYPFSRSGGSAPIVYRGRDVTSYFGTVFGQFGRFYPFASFYVPSGFGRGGVHFVFIAPGGAHFDSYGFTFSSPSFGHSHSWVQCRNFGTTWIFRFGFSTPTSTSNVQRVFSTYASLDGSSVAYSLFVGCTNHHGFTTGTGRGIWIHGQSSSNGHGESGQTTQVHGLEV